MSITRSYGIPYAITRNYTKLRIHCRERQEQHMRRFGRKEATRFCPLRRARKLPMQDLIISQSSFVLKGATIQTALSKFAGLAEIIQRRQLEAPREFRAMIVEHAQHSNWSVILFDDEGIPTKRIASPGELSLQITSS